MSNVEKKTGHVVLAFCYTADNICHFDVHYMCNVMLVTLLIAFSISMYTMCYIMLVTLLIKFSISMHTMCVILCLLHC